MKLINLFNFLYLFKVQIRTSAILASSLRVSILFIGCSNSNNLYFQQSPTNSS
nr:MAG TPA: hypothetical protein [Caudoviricetes sp.]